MSFSTLAFVGFLCVLLLFYYLVPRRVQWLVLLVGSYVFYWFAGWKCLFFIVYTTLTAWGISLLLSHGFAREEAYLASAGAGLEKEQRKACRATEKRKRRRILTLGLVLGFGLLCVFKYTAFAVGNLNAILSAFGAGAISMPSLLLPMGLSFYVFQTMGYLIDVYRGKVQAEKNPLRLALFVSFFPQLVQGPISRYSDLAPQLYAPHSLAWDNVSVGLCRTVYGYFKKVVIADTVSVAVMTLISDTEKYTGMYVVLLILLYSVQIYGDFTGGIDITLGVARMLGIRMAENFDRPFSSESVKEYWRRWHITMGTWFTDYVFYPLSVSRPMQKLSKRSRAALGNALGKRIPVYLATLITWFLTGLWHGAGWNFIVWGILNSVVILVSQELEPLYRRFHAKFPKLRENRGYHDFCAVRTFLIVGLLRSLDCYRNVPLTFSLWGSMFTAGGTYGGLFDGSLLSLGLGIPEWILLFVSVTAVFFVSRASKTERLSERLSRTPVRLCIAVGCMIFAVAVFGAYGNGYDVSSFIYNQF